MFLTNVLKNLTIAGIFLLTLTPLIVTRSFFFPFITGKAFFFRIIVELSVMLWLVLAVSKAEYRPSKSWILISLFLLIGIATLATVFGVNPYESFWSNFERMEGLITYLHLGAYFLVLISILKTETLWRRFFAVSVGVSVVVAGYALLIGGERVAGTLGNPTYLAVYLLFHIFLTGWFVLKYYQVKWWRYVAGLILLLELAALYYTATRGAILGFMIGIIVTAALLALFAGKQIRLRRSAVGFLALILLFAGTLWFTRDSEFVRGSLVLSRFANISTTETTTESRLTIWQMALQGAKERPILGWGPENFGVVFSKYYEPKLWRHEAWFDRSHNIFLDWLISAGLLGLLAYLSMFAGALYYLWRRASNFSVTESAIFSGLLVTYFIHNIFVFDNLVSYLLFFAVLAYIHFRSVGIRPSEAKVFAPYLVGVATVVALAGFSVFTYFINLKPLLASHSLIQSLTANDVSTRLRDFRQALAYNTFGNKEIREQLLITASAIISNDQMPIETKQISSVLALEEMRKQVEQRPVDTRSRLFYGMVLLQVGQLDQAIVQLEKVRELAPRKQEALLVLAQAYTLNGDVQQSSRLVEYIYRLDPDYPPAKEAYDQLANVAL